MIPFTSLLSFGRNWRIALNDSTWLRPTAYQNMISCCDIEVFDIVTNVTVNVQGTRTAPDHTAHNQSHNWPGSGPGPSACRPLSRTPLTGAPQGRTATYIPAQGVKQRNGTGRRSRWGDEGEDTVSWNANSS